MNLRPYGDRAVLIETDRPLDVRAALADRAGVEELIPAAATVLVRFDPAVVSAAALLGAASRATRIDAVPSRSVTLPVHYDGADLDSFPGLDAGEVVARHTGGRYTVAFCGFSPGFAYLTGLDPTLHRPRQSTPRTRVPAGAVAVAGQYTGVYPRASPGGWWLLGRTEASLWDLTRDEPALLAPGMRVRFEAR